MNDRLYNTDQMRGIDLLLSSVQQMSSAALACFGSVPGPPGALEKKRSRRVNRHVVCMEVDRFCRRVWPLAVQHDAAVVASILDCSHHSSTFWQITTTSLEA